MMGNNGTYFFDYAWAGFHVHMFFGFAALVGLILFVTWALRELKGKELKKWAWTLIIVGILGALLTTGFSKAAWDSMWDGHSKMMDGKNQKAMMQMMQGGQMMGGQMMQGGQQMMGGQAATK